MSERLNELDKARLKASAVLAAGLVLLCWTVFLADVTFPNLEFYKLGIFPRRWEGIFGVLFAPFIHGSARHLLSNSMPLFIGTTGILYLYPRAATRVVLLTYLVGGLAVWFLARPSYHVGASGLNYGFVSFIFFSGVIRRDARSMALALIITFLYGSMVWGVLPLDRSVSHESHLYSALVGIAAATLYRNADRMRRPALEDDPEDDDPDAPWRHVSEDDRPHL